MSVRRQTARTESNHTEVAGKLFFNNAMYATVASMRQAAKRFVKTDQFVPALYWEGCLINRRWEFFPIGKGQSYQRDKEVIAR